MRRGLLVTADGESFAGVSVGVDGIATGEVVFNTAMSGYQEIVTDPSYAGQIVVMTAPHIGNYGVNEDDKQATSPHCSGMIMRSLARRHSSWRASGPFGEYLVESSLVALSEIDTRRLTRHVRHRGAMPASMGTDVDEAELRSIAANAPTMAGQNLVDLVTTEESYTVPAESEQLGRIVAYDFGLKRDILRQLSGHGFEVTVVPASTSADAALALAPDGVFLSNGPGDPEPLRGPIESVRRLLGRVPIFGICLGHQIMGLALGARTHKLDFGHHGGNHPVRDLADGSVAITSQNHGFAVDLWTLEGSPPPRRTGIPSPDLLPASVLTDFGNVVATHQNLNDGTLEGMSCRDIPAFSVQYHPEAAPGPHESISLFSRFAQLIAAGA